MTGDGSLDVLTSYSDGFFGDDQRGMQVHHNDGDGHFSLVSEHRVPEDPYWVGLGDMDDDSDLDALVVTDGQETASIYGNPGDGILPPDPTSIDGIRGDLAPWSSM